MPAVTLLLELHDSRFDSAKLIISVDVTEECSLTSAVSAYA